MMEAASSVRAASMAKAMVKSSHEMGRHALRRANSSTRMRRVRKQQKHQLNMHQAQ